MKKSLLFWFAAVTCAALFLVGCESPTNGESGAAGSPGSVTFSGDVTDAELARAFAKSNEVILQSTVTSVYGVIPAGKTLAVFGSDTAVKAGESLEVAGALEIEAGAELDASYVGGTAGYLKGTASGVKGAGTVKLPLVKTGVGVLPTDGIGYADGVAAVKAVGSYITGSVPGSALGNGDIVAIFTASPEITELTVSDITGLTPAAVPAEKTLTLTGANTLANNAAFTVAGTLNVAGGASLATYSTTNTAISGTITNDGTITLTNAGDTLTGTVTNNGTITTSSTTNTVVAYLLTLDGTGTVESSGVVSAAFDAAAALRQNLVIKAGSVTLANVATPLTAAAAKTVEIKSGAKIVLGATATAVGDANVTVVNGGTISTATATDTVLTGLFAKYGAGQYEATGAITGLTAAFEVPADVELTTDSVATFATGTGAVTVNGKFTANAEATFAGKAIAIGDGGVLNVGAGTSFNPDSVTSVESGKIVLATPINTTLESVLAKAGTGLNIEASIGALTLAAAATVKDGTILTLTGTSLTTKSGGDLTVKGKIIAGGLTIDGNNNATGITTTFGAGVTIDAASATAGLSIGIADKITIPAGASINVGGEDGITLGAGTYSAATAAVTIKLATGVPTLTGSDGFVFNVGADTTDGGLLTVGSGSAIVKAGSAKVFTANTEQSPADTKLAVYIAPGATITDTTDNDGGITLADGAIATRTTTTIPGVSESVGLQLVGSDDGSAGWKAGNPAGAGT